jgi:hypothetical protein
VEDIQVTSAVTCPLFPFRLSFGKQVLAISQEASPMTCGESPSVSPKTP